MANQITHGDISIHVGDTVRVHYKLIEKEKVAGKAKREVKEEVRERIQVFEGVVISIRGEHTNKTFTVRRIATGKVGVERIFPIISPWIKKVEIKEKGAVRRAKLFYLRSDVGRVVDKLETAQKAPQKRKKSQQKKGAAKKK